tara:strand:+ start:519 stop:668 length:150 start_codon:yes stop_codon:yes gene_type:complete
MKKRFALKLTQEEMSFLHNKEGFSKLEQKKLDPYFKEKKESKTKKIKKK